MSLKAKIEAVIYTSEEPITLAQLVSLLGGEAQAELDALVSRQESLPLDESPQSTSSADAPLDQDGLNAEVLDPPQLAPEAPASEAPASEAPASEATSSDAISSEAPASEAPAADPAAAQRLAARRLRDYFRSLLDALIADYAHNDRGLEIREVAGGFRLATKPEYHDAVRGFVKSLKPPLKLSLQALETLAVVAYKQPVTAPEVSEIRGVDSGGVLGSLLTRKLITTAGRKQVIGRPILYKTTKDFLLRFGLKDISELPSIEEFESMAGELNEAILDTNSDTNSDTTSDTSSDTNSDTPSEPTDLTPATPEDLTPHDSVAPEAHPLEPPTDADSESRAESDSDSATDPAA